MFNEPSDDLAYSSIIEFLSTSRQRRDEQPNIELARKIAADNNKAAVEELTLLLDDKKLQNDSIKVLYETGEINPSLLVSYYQKFIALLTDKNNRLQWGAMTALYTLTSEIPEKINTALPEILSAASNGSVIIRDHAVKILIRLYAHPSYHSSALPLIKEQLTLAPVNQLPMYAELLLNGIRPEDAIIIRQVLLMRLEDVEIPSKKKRIEKVIQKLTLL